jgi:putative ABC transport system permease protein
MAAAGFVLIISAANVANLTLMRGVNREHELVVRAALGAGVSRLRRLLLAENLLLTIIGASLGVLMANAGVRLLIAFAARVSPRANEIRLDGAVLGFTFAVSLALALLLSLIATLPREGSFASWISAGVRRMSGGVRRQRLQRGLVVTQVAVSVVLLAGAGLLTRTTIQLSEVGTGLRSEEVLTLPLSLFNPVRVERSELLTQDAVNKELYDRIAREIRALPGVVEVGVGSTLPLHAAMMSFEVNAEGRPLAAGEAVPRVELRTANPQYFRAAGIPMIRGREFTSADQPGGARVVIINQTAADKFFPGEDPVGKRIAFTDEAVKMSPFSSDWRTIVGVAGDTRDAGLEALPRAELFAPFAQELAVSGGIVIRADSNAASLAGAATRIVRRIVPGVPVEQVLTVAQLKDQSVAPRRLNAELISSFSLLAVIIAAVGIAGVLAFSVSARTNEIGIRMSLGAGRGQVEWMILKEGGMLLGAGLVLGLVGAYFAGGVIRGLLFNVPAHDPVTLIGVTVVMAAIGIAACWFPAIRAARVDPAITMRSQ